MHTKKTMYNRKTQAWRKISNLQLSEDAGKFNCRYTQATCDCLYEVSPSLMLSGGEKCSSCLHVRKPLKCIELALKSLRGSTVHRMQRKATQVLSHECCLNALQTEFVKVACKVQHGSAESVQASTQRVSSLAFPVAKISARLQLQGCWGAG